MTEPTSQLDYAPPVQLYRRRSFRRAVVAVALVVLAAWLWVKVPYYWENARDAAAYRQWMSYTRPPTQIAFEPQGPKANELWQPGSDYIMRPGGVFHEPKVAGFNRDAIFLHGRQRPDGQRRLVWVSLGYFRTDRLRLRLDATVIMPGTLAHRGGRMRMSDAPLPRDAAGNPPRLYAGQPDPNDESRFTIRYEFPDRGGTIHGRLMNDDSVTFDHVEDALPSKKEDEKP